MGHKVNPIGLRVGINRTWDQRWFASRGEYGKLLHEDMHDPRPYPEAAPRRPAISQGGDRAPAQEVPRHGAHRRGPACSIGKKGADIEKLRGELAKLTAVGGASQHRRGAQARDRRHAGGRDDRPAARAPRRLPPRHEARGAVGACGSAPLGIRINCSGRLGGAEIARMEWYREGRVPLHTLRADIDFGYGRRADGLRHHAASRCGSSRARSWSTTRWRREAARRGAGGRCGGAPRRWPSGGAGGERAEPRPTEGRENDRMLQPKRTKFRKAVQGPYPRQSPRAAPTLNFGSLRPQGGGAGAHHGAPDRGGAARDHART